MLFQTVKFAPEGTQLSAATKMVWDAIKDNQKLDEAPKNLTVKKFTDICASQVQACLLERRQCVQTRGKNACEGASLAWFAPNLISILPLARSFFHRILEDSQEFAHRGGDFDRLRRSGGRATR